MIAAALLKQLLKSNGEDLKKIAAGVITSATKGDAKAFAVIRDSTDGRPTQAINLNATVTVNLADRMEAARRRVAERKKK